MSDHITILPLAALRECPTNPRQHYDQAALQELADSIRSQGLLQPIVVRPVPDQDLHYEVVFGHRRLRAAQLAGLDCLSAIIRDMPDDLVAQAQIHENLARRDVNAYEEAQGLQRLMREFGVTAKQLIDQTGKSKTYIYARLKLLQLADAPREALLAGQIDGEVAGLISRLPAAVQADALDEVLLDGPDGRHSMSYRDAKQALKHLIVELGEAPFPIDVVGLAGKPACEACADRAGNDPAMADMTPMSCARRSCYTAKVGAWLQQQVDEAKAAGRQVIEGEAAEDACRWFPHGPMLGYEPAHEPRPVAPHVKMTPMELLAATGIQAQPALLALPPSDRHAASVMEVVPDDLVRQAMSAYAAQQRAAQDEDGAGRMGGDPDDYATERDRERAAVLAELTTAERCVFDDDHWPKVLAAIASRVRHTPRTADDLRLLVLDKLEFDGEALTTALLASAFGWSARFNGMDDETLERASMALVDELRPDDLAALLVLLALEELRHTHWRARESADAARALALRRLALAQRYGVDIFDPEELVPPADEVQTPEQVADLFDAADTPSTAARAAPGGATRRAGQAGGGMAPADPIRGCAGGQGREGPAVKYHCPLTLATWSGRGLRPAWVRAALASGKTLADLEVKELRVEAGCAGQDQTDDAGVAAGGCSAEAA